MTDSTASSYRHPLSLPPLPPSLPPCLSDCVLDCRGKEIRSCVSLQKGGVKLSDAVRLKTLVEVLQNSGALSLT